jgi:hypothetical protein
VLLDALADRRRGQKPDERTRRVRLLRAAVDSAGKHGDVLKLWRKRPNNPDAPDGNEFAQLMEADLRLAAHDSIADRFVGLRNDGLRLDLIVDA